MKQNKRDLEERTTKFGKEVILFVKNLKRDVVSLPLISQIVRSATSIGANYREATGASSRKDFKNKIFICKKECKETKHWLELIAETNPEHKEKCRTLWKEAQELTLIFSQAIITLEKKL
jgi:four helix bundle protein